MNRRTFYMKRSKYANAYNSRNPTKAHDLIFFEM